MKYEEQVLKGLKRASRESDRDGKWATPPEVRSETEKVPFDINYQNVLTQLVKENRAEKKKGYLLYRPTGGGFGGAGFGSGSQERGWGYPDDDIRGGRDTDGGDRNPAEESVRAGLGAMLGGVAGSATGGSTPTVIR